MQRLFSGTDFLQRMCVSLKREITSGRQEKQRSVYYLTEASWTKRNGSQPLPHAAHSYAMLTSWNKLFAFFGNISPTVSSAWGWQMFHKRQATGYRKKNFLLHVKARVHAEESSFFISGGLQASHDACSQSEEKLLSGTNGRCFLVPEW